MGLQIGKVGKLFGLSPETLRYYQQEGLISPKKNPLNGYREYGFQELLYLIDILFYRDIGIPIRDIKRIRDGLGAGEISALIEEKKRELKLRIQKEQASLTKLQNWESLHTQALSYVNRYDIRPMPPALCLGSHGEDFAQGLLSLQKKIIGNQGEMPEDLAFFLTPSFFVRYSCNSQIRSDDPDSISRYVVLDSAVAQNLSFDYSWANLEEEKAEACVYSVVKYQSSPTAMLRPLLDFAKAHGYTLSGEIYGRQSINIYEKDELIEYYQVYAVLA